MTELDNDEKECDLLLEQYKLLRNEALVRSEMQYKILGFGAGGIGTLIGIAFQFKVLPLFLVLPLAIIASMILFYAERDSILNIRKHIGKLEKKRIKDEELREEVGKSDKFKRLAYRHFDFASYTILITLLFGCIIGILSFQGEVSGFGILNNPKFKLTVAIIYSVTGLCLFSYYLHQSHKGQTHIPKKDRIN